MVFYSISIENPADMEKEKNPKISWEEVPWAQPIIQQLNVSLATSALSRYCDFEKYIQDLRKLKVPVDSFGAASAKFIEGEQIALRLQQFMDKKSGTGPDNRAAAVSASTAATNLPCSLSRDRGNIESYCSSVQQLRFLLW